MGGTEHTSVVVFVAVILCAALVVYTTKQESRYENKQRKKDNTKKPNHRPSDAKAKRKAKYGKNKRSVTSEYGSEVIATNAQRLASIEECPSRLGEAWYEVDVEEKGADINMEQDTKGTTIGVFRDLKDKNLVERQGLCIVEGPEPIQLLLRSKLQVVALALRRPVLERLKPTLDAARENQNKKDRKPFPVYVLSRDQIARLVGFNSCRGSLACAVVPPQPTLSDVLPATRRRWRIVAVDGSTDAANVGSVIRTSTALGADLVLLSDNSCDCWYRQAVRVSMGHVFSLPVIRCPLAATLKQLHSESGVDSFAAVIDFDAPSLYEMGKQGSDPKGGTVPDVPARWCAVVGNEHSGICDEVRAACTHRVRIPMADGVDSLAITVATGIVVAGLVEREPQTDNAHK